MPRIQPLQPLVINQIAAGEVIERPASVVKELLENSVDALATRIEVDVVAGGSELIRVVDNGEGIHPDDLKLAVTSHATSKVIDARDLFQVRTLGFRGEALASIASVSRMRIRSRQAETDTAYEINIESGQVGDVQPVGGPEGTLIEVHQLFANTPVRRKFLKTTGTEFGHLSEQFTRVVLAHPRLHAVLRHNGKTVYELPSNDQFLERLRVFYGTEMADKLIPVESESGNVKLWGYVGHPSLSKSTRKGQYLFLNGRWIQDRSLQHALGEAYRGLLMVGRFPVAFLFLEMPPEDVDVNVHPTKAEVRFRDSQQLYRQLLSSLRSRFLGMDLDSEMSLPRRSSSVPATSPEQQREIQTELADWAKSQLESWQPTLEPTEILPVDLKAKSVPVIGSEGTVVGSASWEEIQHQPERSRNFQSDDESPFEAAESFSRLDQPGDSPNPMSSSNAQRFTGAPIMQIHDCYLVIESDEGLTVIDQHALHERVLYEQFRKRVLDEAVESQKMLVPETVEMGTDEASTLMEHRDLLKQLGFEIEEFGGNTILLSAYPPMLARADRVQLLRDIAEQILGTGQKPTRRDILDELLHMMSCKAAVKAGQRLSPEEMESLLAQRHLIDDAHHCPHGRPTALVLSRAELDRQFGRLG
ncbi:MAG: DNA mismatch repair endonuclease MutL [Planctomycetaceae bacterium]